MPLTDNLNIRCEAATSSEVVASLESILPDHWFRDQGAEQNLHGVGKPDWLKYYCFTRKESTGLPSAAIWLTASPSAISVTNVVPLSDSEFSEHEYNDLIREFVSLVKQIPREIVVEHVEATGFVAPDEVLTNEGVKKLTAFFTLAHPGGLHPLDWKRWDEFVMECHVGNRLFEPELLDQWLEQKNWPEDRRHELIEIYERQRAILSDYESLQTSHGY